MPIALSHSGQGELFNPADKLNRKTYTTIDTATYYRCVEACERHFFPIGKPEKPHKNYNIENFVKQWVYLNVESFTDEERIKLQKAAISYFEGERGKIRIAQDIYKNLEPMFVQSGILSVEQVAEIHGGTRHKIAKLLELNNN